MTLGVFMMVLN